MYDTKHSLQRDVKVSRKEFSALTMLTQPCTNKAQYPADSVLDENKSEAAAGYSKTDFGAQLIKECRQKDMRSCAGNDPDTYILTQ